MVRVKTFVELTKNEFYRLTSFYGFDRSNFFFQLVFCAAAIDMKLSKVTVLCNQAKFEQLKSAMNDIGVTGMTVTQVLGCGIQKGRTEYYRGVPLSMNLLPKLMGFCFDNSAVADKLSACAAIFNEYKGIVNTGTGDPEANVAAMMEAMRSSGFDDIVAEVQRQLDEYLASK